MKKFILMVMLLIPAAATFAQDVKFGHVDVQAVMESLPEFIKARGEIEAQSKQYENDLKAMEDEIKRKSDDYEKTRSTMNATKQQETEANIQQLIQKYQQAYQDNQQALQKMQQDMIQPIQAKIFQAIEAVGKNGGYVYIMQSQSLPYISATLSKDVTNDVKAEINKLK